MRKLTFVTIETQNIIKAKLNFVAQIENVSATR